jgi:L-ascorbate metabolism protein UlaG (beta-lactamase superfamily)
MSVTGELGLRRLAWAGVEVNSGAERLLIDPLEDADPLAGFLGSPRAPLAPIDVDGSTWVLVTHLHPDHCDRRLLDRVAAGRVVCHGPIAETLRRDGIEAMAVRLWETTRLGPFQVTAVPSQDWRGDDQVAWVVEASGRRIIHCGDTIWHGKWWEIARRHGPFDVAFVPINGVIARLEGFTPTEVPATLTPEQAIEASVVLGAGVACAIHHGLFNNPPRYVEQPDAVGRLLAAALRRSVRAVAPPGGGPVAWP